MTTDTNRALELKPCPFCGKSYFITGYGMGARAKIRCTWCEADGPVALDGESEAIAAWNRRAAPVPVEDVAGVGEPDMRKVVEALGFEPDNHHNALKCPYCNPDGLAFPTQGAGVQRLVEALENSGDTMRAVSCELQDRGDEAFAQRLYQEALECEKAVAPFTTKDQPHDR